MILYIRVQYKFFLTFGQAFQLHKMSGQFNSGTIKVPGSLCRTRKFPDHLISDVFTKPTALNKNGPGIEVSL